MADFTIDDFRTKTKPFVQTPFETDVDYWKRRFEACDSERLTHLGHTIVNEQEIDLLRELNEARASHIETLQQLLETRNQQSLEAALRDANDALKRINDMLHTEIDRLCMAFMQPASK